MADEADSKSVVGNHVRVQVPLPAANPYNPNLFPIGNWLGLLVFRGSLQRDGTAQEQVIGQDVSESGDNVCGYQR